MIDNIPPAALATVAASIVAGLLSVLGLVISKESKISEFRQAWIDALRHDLTTYLTNINNIRDALSVDYQNHGEKVKALGPLFSSLNFSTFDIALRVNPDETFSKALLSSMKNFSNILEDQENIDLQSLRESEQQLLIASKQLLKHEWKRVKSGETTFKVAKFLSIIIVLLSLVAGGFLIFSAKNHRAIQSSESLHLKKISTRI